MKKCVINFYQLIDTININQIIYWLLSIDKSILIFVNWPLQDIHEWATVTTNATILHTISGECILFVSQPFDQVAYPQNSYQETTWV